jgi:hypothetical protein
MGGFGGEISVVYVSKNARNNTVSCKFSAILKSRSNGDICRIRYVVVSLYLQNML